MPQNDTDDTTDEQPTGPHTRRPLESLGDAEVRIDIDPDTYERLHAEYCRAIERGYSDNFDTFVYNYCSTDCYVTVDGEPIDPDAEPRS
jgi:hypothetical protein